MSDIPVIRDPAVRSTPFIPDAPLAGTASRQAALPHGELLPRVIEVVARTMERDVLAINIDTTFHELGADSLDTHNLILAFEDEFDISITDEEAEHLNSVAQVLAYIGERKAR